MVRSKAEKILKVIEKQARGKRFLPIVGSAKGQILAKIIRDKKPKRVLEVGALVGYSAILMGKELEKDAYIITIEIDTSNARIAEENIRKAEIPPTVEVLVGDAIEIIPRLNGPFDFSFIDAKKTEYLHYLQLMEEKLRRGSVIVADNVARAPSYLHYVKSSGKYQSRFECVNGTVLASPSEPYHRNGLEISVKL
jgi:predicted O-methyltransferase YrrM